MPIDVPAWAADAVFYQVFPDRYARSGRVPAPGAYEPWDAAPTRAGFKGGDLLGLVDRLDDLADLGISGLYLNPVFSAASNHRYNASDYLAVDPLLGGEVALRALVDGAHERGIRVLLDGVFNHSGRGFFPFQHVLESGTASPYRDWFYLDRDVRAGRRWIDAYPPGDRAGHHDRAGFRAWWNIPSLPKLRVEHPPVREYLFGVAEHWLRFGIDGWRLDVPAEIEDESFWPEFRARVRSVKPDAYLVGEIWTESPEWLSGDRFDALMNYPLGLAILGFASAGNLDRTAIDGQTDYRRDLVARDGSSFAQRIEQLFALHDPATTSVQYNLIGSHDAPRARTCLAGDIGALRLATLLQLILPGTPSIYYGDELGMEGGPDPDCRRAYPVEPDADGRAMRRFTRAAIHARRAHVALRRGSVAIAAADGQAIALSREADGQRALIAVNSGRAATRLVVDRTSVAGLAALVLPEVPVGRLVDGTSIELPAQGALVLA
ncbi:MAG TPA: alpha-amylase family glycosyl hydrolase [Patescibacteria group bacterium]|nr:alpha-amylase family glycosyl hydrolase [Patescibacteria group bacterium]